MANSASIKVGKIEGFSWIKISGKGNVFLTPTVKIFTEAVLEESSKSNAEPPKFIFDMEECLGMDSTFMGMLAGLAIKVQGLEDSSLALCSLNAKNTDSLEELGIDSLVSINPTDAIWVPYLQQIRSSLSDWSASEDATPDPRLILDTHKTLSSLNKANEKEFSAVIKTFESQIND